MVNVLVLYYSSYGHLEQMAYAQSEGVSRISGARVVVKRVAELVPADVAKASGFRLDQKAPVADPLELENYDAILFGTPTRFGHIGNTDAQLSGPDRPAMGAQRAGGKNR